MAVGGLEKFYTTEQLAELMHTAPSTVRYWTHMGKGPRSIKRGKRRLYPESAVRDWLTDSSSEVAS